MQPCVRDDGTFAREPVGHTVLQVLCGVDLIHTILKQNGKLLLHELQGINWSVNCAFAATSLGDFERLVLGGVWLLEQDISEGCRLELQQRCQFGTRRYRPEAVQPGHCSEKEWTHWHSFREGDQTRRNIATQTARVSILCNICFTCHETWH